MLLLALVFACVVVVEPDELQRVAGSRAIVVGVGEAASAANELAASLRATAGVELVIGADALGAITGLDDASIVKKASALPIDSIIILRAYPGSEGQVAYVVLAYGKDGAARGSWSRVVPPEASSKAGALLAPQSPPPAMPASPPPPTAPVTTEEQPTAGPAAGAAASKRTVVVVEPARHPFRPEQAKAIAARMGVELSRVSRFQVTTAADMRRMLELEANRQLSGCADVSCLSEVADALGAELVLAWEGLRAADDFIVDVALYDGKKGLALHRAQARGGVEELIEEVARATNRVVRDYLRAEDAKRDPLQAARLRYSDERVEWVKANETYFPKRAGKVLQWDELYSAVDREDLADELRTRRLIGITALAVGVPIGVIAAIGGFAYMAANENEYGSISEQTGLIGLAIMLPGGALVVGSAFGGGHYLDSRPLSQGEEFELVAKHNELLRRQLGLPVEQETK